MASLNPSGLRPYKLQGGVAIPRGYSNVTAAITRLPLLMETRENPKPVGRNRFIAPLRADPYAKRAICRKPPQMAQRASLIAPPHTRRGGTTNAANRPRGTRPCVTALMQQYGTVASAIGLVLVLGLGLVGDRPRLEAVIALARRAVEPRSQRQSLLDHNPQ